MKLLIILLLLPFLCFSQRHQPPLLYGKDENRIAVLGNLVIPKGIASVNDLAGYDVASIRYNAADSSIYIHTGSQWLKIVSNLAGRVFATASDLSPLFTTIDTSDNIEFKLDSTDAYTIFGRSVGRGLPFYLTSLDSNFIPELHSQNYYDIRYGAATSTLTFVDGLYKTGTIVHADFLTPMWDADRIQGFLIDPTPPTQGQMMYYDQSTGFIRWKDSTAVGGGGGGSPSNIYLNDGQITDALRRVLLAAGGSLKFSSPPAGSDSMVVTQSPGGWSSSFKGTGGQGYYQLIGRTVEFGSTNGANNTGGRIVIDESSDTHYEDYNPTPTGIQYFGDYRATLVDNSLVPKNYVDDAIAYKPLAAFYNIVDNVSTTETDLFSYTVPANTLAADGSKLLVEFNLRLVSPTSATIKLYFAGALIGSEITSLTPFTVAEDLKIRFDIYRIGSGSARFCITVTGGTSGAMYNHMIDASAGGLWSTADILKITGQDASGSTVRAFTGFIDYVRQP